MDRRSFVLGGAALAGLADTVPALAAGTGAVLIHGKQDSSWGSLTPVARALGAAGVQTVAPDFPWSGSRFLSGNWPQAMAEIGQAVATLKGNGATKIVLIGHSMGCPAAMSYASQRGGVAGLVLAGPGHAPGGFYQSGLTRESVDRARALVKAGKGGEVGTFADRNQARVNSVTLPAADYLSYYDPQGPCNMFITAGRVRVPAMWVAGTADEVVNWGESIGRRLSGGKGRYLVVQADHRSTPAVAAAEIADWVAKL